MDKIISELKTKMNNEMEEVEKRLYSEPLLTAYEYIYKSDMLTVVGGFIETALDDYDYAINILTKLNEFNSPLDFIYREWLKNDRSIMEDLRETIEEICQEGYESDDEEFFS